MLDDALKVFILECVSAWLPCAVVFPYRGPTWSSSQLRQLVEVHVDSNACMPALTTKDLFLYAGTRLLNEKMLSSGSRARTIKAC